MGWSRGQVQGKFLVEGFGKQRPRNVCDGIVAAAWRAPPAHVHHALASFRTSGGPSHKVLARLKPVVES